MEKRHIVFSSAFSEKDFKIIQLEKDVEEAIKNGETWGTPVNLNH